MTVCNPQYFLLTQEFMSTTSLPDPEHFKDHFPADFIWGVATSAFQIEGAAQADGKGPSIWDEFCRLPGVISDSSNGDVACDHYRRYASDLDLIASLNVDAYRFSISWPRVQPAGSGQWNEAGMDFYERLIDGLLSRGIKPYLTLNHWDLFHFTESSAVEGLRDSGAKGYKDLRIRV